MKKFLHVQDVAGQTWFIYEFYDSNYQLICYMAQPMGNTRYCVRGKTEEDLIANVEKCMLSKGSIKQETR